MTVTAQAPAPPRPRTVPAASGRSRTVPAAKPAAAQAVKPTPPAAPSRRRGVTPLTPMRQQAAKSMRTLAKQVQASHPDMTVHDHLRDAAKTLEAGNEEGAQQHLRAAMFALTPQSLMRNGIHTDDAHIAARQAMHRVHRHLLLTKNIADAGARNREAIAKLGGEDGNAPRPQQDPNNGYGPGALAQKPTARQPPGDQALNAPAKADGGGSDPAAADPDGPQPKGSKQFAYGWDDLCRVIVLTGDGHGHHIPGSPMVYKHGFIPIAGTELGKDGIRRPAATGNAAKAAGGAKVADRAPAAKVAAKPRQALAGKPPAAVKLPESTPKAVPKAKAPEGKAAVTPPPKAAAAPAVSKATGPQADLNAAIKSGEASRKAPGSAKVSGSQGDQGGVRVVTFNNGAQYIHKDFKGVILPYPERMGGDRPMPLQEKKLLVAKESLAAHISDVIGAGAPAILRDPHSTTGFYEPKVPGKSAMEHFSGGSRDKSAEKLYNSPEGMRIGLMDAVIGADDRHLGNVMITPQGKPVPIDHNDAWVLGRRVGRSPFAIALDKQIKAGKSPFSTADLDQVKAKIQALKPEFDAMPDGNGARYYQMTMGELERIRGQVAGK